MAQLRVTVKALPAHSRQNNRSLLLQILFQEGPMSRADLARASGLTRVTVSDLVSELESEDLIRDLGRRTDARVGKPATLIAVDEDSRHVISLDLSAEDAFTGAVVNLGGAIVQRRRVPLEGATGEAALRHATALARELIDLTTVPVLGIGIGTPGVVDRAGVVREAPNLGWVDLDVRAAFATSFDLPVHVANDANAAALAVHTFHRSTGASLMLVTIGHGLGAGLIVGGSLVQGDHFTAGEIGHVVVDENGERCTCGRKGCLELSVAIPSLKRRLHGSNADERGAVLAAAGRSLGIALSPIVAATGLTQVILAGPEEYVAGPLLESARDTVAQRTLQAVGRGLEIRAASTSDELMLRGGTVLVLAGELGIS